MSGDVADVPPVRAQSSDPIAGASGQGRRDRPGALATGRDRPAGVTARWDGPYTPGARVEADRFEHHYEESADPWGYETNPYEHGKYAATLAALDGGRFERALEVGCSIGAFTARLAGSCGRLTALDFSERAVELARARVGELENVTVKLGSFPEQASAGPWDLVTCSEVLYYLDRPTLELAVEWLQARLGEGATVLAVDWRGPAQTEPLGGDELHELLIERLGQWHALSGRHPRFRLDRFDGRAQGEKHARTAAVDAG